MNGWTPCALGCGLSHRDGDAYPIHDARWLSSRLDQAHELLVRWLWAPPAGDRMPIDAATAVFMAPLMVTKEAANERPTRHLSLLPPVDATETPVTDLESVRVPRLTDASGPAGVSVDVALVPPPRKR